MNKQTEMTKLLDLMVQPGFCVQDHLIVGCNQAARRLLISPGTDVRSLLETGAAEYEAFSDGCLCLRLNLEPGGCSAAVCRVDGYDVFVLDQEADNGELCALALAAQTLRYPISSILIAADQIGQAAAQTGDPTAQAQAGQLSRGVYQLLRIVNNMSDALLYTSVSQQEIQNITGVFSEIFEKARTLLEQSGLTLRYQGLDEDLYALADAQQLERAVLNILSNAAKFTPAGGSISARLTRRGELLRLSIQDNGAGIQDDILEHIFSRYLRRPGLEDSRFGLGLGMVLIRTAAANHGGAVLIDQKDGTRVTMTMALRQNKEALLRSPVYRVDYAGGRDHALIELSQNLPASLYEK